MNKEELEYNLSQLLDYYREQPLKVEAFSMAIGAIDEFDTEKYYSYLDFKHDDKHFFQPLNKKYLKLIIVGLVNGNYEEKNIFPYILPRYQQYLKEEIQLYKENKGIIKEISNKTMHKNILFNITQHFNNKLILLEDSSKKNQEQLISAFLNEQKKLLLDFFNYGFNDFEDLFYFTSLLRNPKLQFNIIQKMKKYHPDLLSKFNNLSAERKIRIFYNYCMNIPNLNPNNYSKQWKGYPKILINYTQNYFLNKQEYENMRNFLEDTFLFETEN